MTVFPGDNIDVQRAILNAGGLAGSASYTILLSEDATITIADAVALTDTTPSIGAGASDVATVTCIVPEQLSPGDYYVGLYIDSANLVATTDPDVTVAERPISEDEFQSCGCSPIGGVATPADIFGMLLPFVLLALAVFRVRKRRSTSSS